MHHSVLTGVILLLLTSFLRVECGKDPLQRKAIETAQNEVVKSSEVTEIENSKTSVAEVEGGETLKNDTSATFSITVSTDSFSDAGKDGEKDLSAVPKPRPGMAYLSKNLSPSLKLFLFCLKDLFQRRISIEKKKLILNYKFFIFSPIPDLALSVPGFYWTSGSGGEKAQRTRL